MAEVLALSSSVVWGSSDFGGGVLSRRRPAIAVAVVSQAISLAVLVVTATVLHTWSAPLGFIPYGVLAGVFGSAGIIAFYRALGAGPMGLVAPIAATAVVLPVLTGIVHGERPSPLQYAGIALAVIGVILASGPELDGGAPVKRSTVLLSVVAAVGFGGYFAVIAEAKAESLPMVLLAQRTTNVAIGIVLVLASGTAVAFSKKEWPLVAFVGIGDMSANALYAAAVRHGSISVVAVLSSLYPLVTALLARGFLDERLRRVQQVGAGITLLGVVFLAAG